MEHTSVSPSFRDALCGPPLQQTPPGGVGTTPCDDSSTNSSFSFSPETVDLLSWPSGSLSYDIPLLPTAGPSTPESLISSPESLSSPESFTLNSGGDSSSEPSKPKEFRCTFPECKSKNKVFALKCLLRKHQKNHTLPTKCPYCTTFPGAAEWKDLARHVRSCHPNEARNNKGAYCREMAQCPDCGKTMRADNLKRHRKTCAVRKAGLGDGVQESKVGEVPVWI